jgi:hypothetical protein
MAAEVAAQTAPPEKPDTPFNQWIKSIGIIHIIGIMIILLSVGILIYLLALARLYINASKDSDSFNHIKELFGMLLPVVSTWMGTVLAFYFTKENYEAANRNVSAMVTQVTAGGIDGKLQELKASEIMLKPDTFCLKLVKDMDAFKAEKLCGLIDMMEKTHSERMPVLQEGSMKFVFLIYQQTIDRFISGVSKGTIKLKDDAKKETADLTVQDMLDSDFPLIKNISSLSFKDYFLPVTATMSEVKEKMQDNAVCQDVFLTKTGSSDEPVLGWVTNNLVIEKAELFKRAGTKM